MSILNSLCPGCVSSPAKRRYDDRSTSGCTFKWETHMNHRHRYTQRTCIFDIIPPYILESIARTGTETQRAIALQTLALDERIRSQRAMRSQVRLRGAQSAGP